MTANAIDAELAKIAGLAGRNRQAVATSSPTTPRRGSLDIAWCEYGMAVGEVAEFKVVETE